jgi:branched-chain amino acid transport system ATP-binding protein
VKLSVGAGECVALMGRNGAGKSTALKAIMGLVARRGSIQWQGRDISAAPAYRISRLGLGWVPEDRRVFTDLTVRENLAIGRQPPRDGAPTGPRRSCSPSSRTSAPCPTAPAAR